MKIIEFNDFCYWDNNSSSLKNYENPFGAGENNTPSRLFVRCSKDNTFHSAISRALQSIHKTKAGCEVLTYLASVSRHYTTIVRSTTSNCYSAIGSDDMTKVANELIYKYRFGIHTEDAIFKASIGIGPYDKNEWLANKINNFKYEFPPYQDDCLRFLKRSIGQNSYLLNCSAFRWKYGYNEEEYYFPEKRYLSVDEIRFLDLKEHSFDPFSVNEFKAWRRGLPLEYNTHGNETKDRRIRHLILSLITVLYNYFTPGPGAGVTIGWNPDDIPAPELDIEFDIDTIKRPPATGLAHELIHAYYCVQGKNPGTRTGFGFQLSEHLCVGLYPFQNSKINENKIRSEWQPDLNSKDPRDRILPLKRVRYF